MNTHNDGDNQTYLDPGRNLRQSIQECLTKASAVVENQNTIFCIEPFCSVNQDGGEQLYRLLSRVLKNPDQGTIILGKNAMIFAFKNQLARNQGSISST